MSVITFTDRQLKSLANNPNVESVTSRRITYTDDFKRLFIERYRLGIQPKDIFKDAGFDVEVLGTKRIERAAARWRQMNNEGRLGDEIDYVAVQASRQRQRSTLVKTIEHQNALILTLEEENRALRDQLAKILSS